MKMVSSNEECDAELVEQAMTVIHDNIEGKLDQSTYIRAYSSLQDDVRNSNNTVFLFLITIILIIDGYDQP